MNWHILFILFLTYPLHANELDLTSSEIELNKMELEGFARAEDIIDTEMTLDSGRLELRSKFIGGHVYRVLLRRNSQSPHQIRIRFYYQQRVCQKLLSENDPDSCLRFDHEQHYETIRLNFAKADLPANQSDLEEVFELALTKGPQDREIEHELTVKKGDGLKVTIGRAHLGLFGHQYEIIRD